MSGTSTKKKRMKRLRRKQRKAKEIYFDFFCIADQCSPETWDEMEASAQKEGFVLEELLKEWQEESAD